MPILYWGHGALSVVLLVARVLPERIRAVVVRVVCGLGAVLGVALFLERRSGDAWRTTEMDPSAAALSGVAVAAAWIIAGVLTEEDDRWRAASLVGIGAVALVLFGQTRWAVPALLFWTLSSLAAGAQALGARRRGEIWVAIVVSDVCFAAGMIGHVVDGDSWRLPLPAPERAFWFLLAAVVLRAGVIPRFGLWRGLGTPAAAALPLVVGSAFILAAGAGGREEPWAAVGLLVVGLGQAVWGVLQSRLAPADFAGWAVAVCLAVIYATPQVAALAGIAAVLAVSVVALWPLASGRAGPERGLALTLVPPTAAFGALVFAAKHAFEVATTTDSTSQRIPWTATAALLPLTMAVGAVLGARAGRERWSSGRDRWPVGATWLFVGGSIALGLAPGALELPDDVVGSQRSFLTLLLVALAAGGLSGWLWSLRHPDHRRAPAPEPTAVPVGPPTRRETVAARALGTPLLERMLDLVAAALALATVAAVGWVTYEGLSQGFL